jgi:hypothetical protein
MAADNEVILSGLPEVLHVTLVAATRGCEPVVGTGTTL